ncbi:hypothetical protein CKM354_000406700 [Cercospora kikuchii]|uniref:Myosin class II heavy chain n=1 Tax=Cercospora kikuchii TaxID=84275 RepID=A0A9P3FFE7_9PEZI|nr:uncharacterized protein CKM354_000406700 [Cercospora kikuchii]GIZ40739.1 hypothetical protein CKM354_000406700 [Cercospora kikuchii]
MSSLLASRWAETPDASAENPLERAGEELNSADTTEQLPKDLLTSRWAATPEEEEKQKRKELSEQESLPRSGANTAPQKQQKEEVDPNFVPKSVMASRWADTPPPEDEERDLVKEVADQQARDAAAKEAAIAKQEALLAQINGSSDPEGAPEAGHESPTATLADLPASLVPGPPKVSAPAPTPSPSRLEPPRLKKRVSWRGKNIVIAIPRYDYEAAGFPKPMSKEEIASRIKTFEDAGYSTSGYDLTEESSIRDGPAQVKDIFPDEREARVPRTKDQINVMLPDLAKWKAYMDFLTEQKLAALGVSLGFDEPAPLPPLPVAGQMQDLSRQSSGQYPPLPFSPPIPTGSASSMGRPTLMRGHSHTMSVASPISPMNGPFGHMHRHSTFTGSSIGFPGSQPQSQFPTSMSPGIPGLQAQSPSIQVFQAFNQQQQPFNLQQGMLPRGGSPAQIAALRQDLGRGPGSPLSQQILPQSPQDYSRGLVEDYRRKQHAYSQSMAAPSMPNSFLPYGSHGSSLRPTPALPELAEDDEEEQDEAEEAEASTYVPPHKRVQASTEIVVPTPKGHRHNISEGLERDLLEAEKREKTVNRDVVKLAEESENSQAESKSPDVVAIVAPKDKQQPAPKVERDPLGDQPVQESAHSRKKSATTRFNVAAPSFTFNPSAEFKPSQPFTFGAPTTIPTFDTQSFAPVLAAPAPDAGRMIGHNRHQSSGSFNANAATFKPTSSDFSFSASGPAFGSDAPKQPMNPPSTIVDELPKIFGKVDIPDIVKPARRSKAIAIVKPPTPKASSDSEEPVDDEGRIQQGNAKRGRKMRDDGDQVPQFALPSDVPAFPVPAERVLGSNVPERPMSTLEEAEAEVDAEDAVTEISEITAETSKGEVFEQEEATTVGAEAQPKHGHKHSTSLSALAKPFQPPATAPAETGEVNAAAEDQRYDSISDLEEGEIREEGPRVVSPIAQPLSFGLDTRAFQDRPQRASQERIDIVTDAGPSFDEIDAVMRHLNATESEREPTPMRMPSPGSHPMKGVTYLADWGRREVPSPSPRRQDTSATPQLDRTTDLSDMAFPGYPHVRQLNKAEEVPTSDWSDMLSPPDAEKFDQRSTFFDNHIDKLIGRAVESRLLPLEESLRSIQNTVIRRNKSSDLQLKRTPSTVESDADDEDEHSDEHKTRPISRGRDKRIDQIKLAVLEALREQSPKRMQQQAMDIADLHTVLADMKVSFARAASSNLELDDIRAVVEETVRKQPESTTPAEQEGPKRDELLELEGRLNETLAKSLEEANQRRAIEEREAESRRQLRLAEERESQVRTQLRLAEEELQLQRDAARDEEQKVRVMEKEREAWIERLDVAEEARQKAQERIEDSEAEKEALQATLEEYRLSSHKWRHDSEEGKRVREELQSTVNMLTRQAEEYQESTMGMKRRLEKLHEDMSTAAGQLASEKAVWRSKEEEYRAKIEALEHQQLVSARERAQLVDEMRIVRASAVENAEARNAVDHARSSNQELQEMMHKLQAQLTEQQGLTARYERQFYDAQESGRAEVHRTRMAFETEVEAANNRVNLVRAQLETELGRTRSELENARMELETMKERQEHLQEQAETDKREALRKVNHSNSVALDEARHKYESGIQELTSQHSRALRHALEDKDRVESVLNERLNLMHEKLQHYQERCAHLEERLEIAKTAAQHAAKTARASKAVASPAYAPQASFGPPEKISPQALRESILVLQEQLQERETRIERLEADAEDEGQTKKQKEDEIAFLRELLAVRNEELNELITLIQKPNFDRARCRDIAIRLRANLQMEQEEKDRFARPSGQAQSVTGQASALLSSLATPKVAQQQLSSAFSKWRANMESSALKNAPRYNADGRLTPSKGAPSQAPLPKGYQSGLMTPPASNFRSSPRPESTDKLPPPRLNSRQSSHSNRPVSRGSHQSAGTERPRSRHSSGTSQRPVPFRQTSGTSQESAHAPLFHEQSYDQDAEDSAPIVLDEVEESFAEDDSLDDIPDSAAPPGFRSLQDEMGEPTPMSEFSEPQAA